MTTALGLDMSSRDDLDETRTSSSLALAADDAIWRLKTPRAQGILAADAPDYGMDLLEAIGSASTEADAAALPGRIRAELTKDDRFLSVDATVTRTVEGPATAYDIRIAVTTADGPFELVGALTDGELDLAAKLLPGGI